MKKLSYSQYFDKVFGCWMGKCISGTIGAPFEGRKELFDYTYDPRSIENMLPNDDLDLQVLWLEVMEKKGIYFTTEDLADAFLNQCPYGPGEYAVFKKNYQRGVRPPLSGKFNNSYYLNGMGCPIRSEIWACVAPANPGLARKFSMMDGVMDHGDDSVQAEVFLAAMEAAAFFEKDIVKLIGIGLEWIPQQNKVAAMVRDVMEWAEQGHDWRYTRELIINHYGHPDCTNLYQNMGFTILALLYGKGDFIDTTMIALNCGYDTDCTCATVGALLGIIYGAEYLIDRYGFQDTGYILGVNVIRRTNLIRDLAEDTCRAGLTVALDMNREVEIEEYPGFTPIPHTQVVKPVEIRVAYDEDIPAIGIGEGRKIYLEVSSHSQETVKGALEIKLPEQWVASLTRRDLTLLPGKGERIPVLVTVPENVEILHETNLLTATFKAPNVPDTTYDFGIIGAAVWKMYGPFWQNNLTIPPIDYWDSYYKYIEAKDENEGADKTRTYHVNARADIDREYMSEPDLGIAEGTLMTPSLEGKRVNIYTDRFSVNDLTKLQGPCVVYLQRELYAKEDRTVGIHIGHSDAYKLWVNDVLISETKDVDWCTNENKHVVKVKLNKGINRMVFKLCRRSATAEYSLIFCEGGPCTNHYGDFSSMNPNRA